MIAEFFQIQALLLLLYSFTLLHTTTLINLIDAILHGVETRTSAPVQILRHKESCECVSLPGLFPAGEGAGYAGGIVSAAVDGLRVAQGILGMSIEQLHS